MNQLYCPGCGAVVCDFVIYCPECGFSVKEYQEKQRTQNTADFFADMLPFALNTEQETASETVSESPSDRHRFNKKRLIIAALAFLLSLTVIIVSIMLTQQNTGSGIKLPVVTSTNYIMNDCFDTRLQSENTDPYVAVYRGSKGDTCCVYFENGVGEYTGSYLSEGIGYLPVDETVHMKTIDTFYQHYVEGSSNSFYLLDFDITFDQDVSGLFVYDLSYGLNRPEMSNINDSEYWLSGSVSVKDGRCRVTELVENVPVDYIIQSKLTPKCFVRLEGETLEESKRLWGGQVKFIEFNTYCTAICDQRYTIDESRYDPKSTVILCRYTIESGGNDLERGKSTYYQYLTEEDNRTEIDHYQYLYGSNVSKPTYTLDVFGFMSLNPFSQ